MRCSLHIRPLQLVLLLALLVSAIPYSANAAPTSTPEPSPAVAPKSAARAALICDTTPFGNFIVAGAERELMLSYRTGATIPAVRYELIDRDGTSLRRVRTVDGVSSPREVAGTPVDAGTDGIMDFAQVYVDSAGALQRVVHRIDTSDTPAVFASAANMTLLTAAAAPASYRGNAIPVAFRSNTGSLRVEQGSTQGASTTFWFDQRGSRLNPQAISLAVGDLQKAGFARERTIGYIDGNGQTRLLVLTFDPAAQGGGSGFGFNGLRELADLDPGIGRPQSVQVAVADLDGDFQPEVILAQDQLSTSSAPLSEGIAVAIYKPTLNGSTFTLTRWAQLNIGNSTLGLKLAAADTDRDGRAEVVLAYQRAGSDTVNTGLVVASYDLRSELDGSGTFILHNQYFREQLLATTYSLALAADDMDRDGLADIAFAFTNQSQMLVQRINDSLAPGQGFTLAGALTETTPDRARATQLVLGFGDADNDSLIAHYTPTSNVPLCKDVIEPQITAAIFTPPYWADIQANQSKYGSIGEYRSTGTTTANEMRTTYSHSVSAYLGFEVDGEAFKASVRATGGYNWETSTGSRSSITQQTTQNVSFSNTDGSFVAIEEPLYNCYNYQIEQQGSVRDGLLRYCAYQSRTRTSVSLDAWDQQYAAPTKNPNQWAPVTREWANLALFRGDLALQSSTDGVFTASRAADGNWRSGGGSSISRTQNETNPWWQIDLGATQDVTKVRIYSRDQACAVAVCTPLADLRVFISDTDPQTISNDPAVLQADSRVKSFVLAGGLGELTNVRTLQANNAPTRGRFLRVQRAGTGVLALTEVQAFGRNQIDPDRYPFTARDLTANDDVFEVQVYNPRATGANKLAWVPMRGNLRWQAGDTGPLSNVKVGNGGNLLTWSLRRDYSSEYSTSTSSGNGYRVGAEFDVAAGIGARITAGGSYEFSTTFDNTETRSTSTSSGLELGGEIGGFPTSDPRPSACEYGFRPFTYEVKDEASSGFQHGYLVLDYLVPQNLPTRTLDFTGCRASTTAPPTNDPQLTVNFPNGTPGSNFVVSAQNFRANSRAVIALQEPGASLFRNLVELQLNSAGTLVFVLATAGTAPVGEYRVRITVDPLVATAANLAAADVREATFILNASAPQRTEQPPNTPVVTVAPGTAATVTRFTFLPLTRGDTNR